MKLREFLDGMHRGGMAAFAAKVGISPIYISQLAAVQDGRRPSPELCANIVRQSCADVQYWDLRPDDWHLIWPMVINTEGAPAPQPAELTEPAQAVAV